MQQPIHESGNRNYVSFQYPLSGRRLCSPAVLSPPYPLPWVSVPSIGSKAVQPVVALVVGRLIVGFSTLYRVEGCAALTP
ncbi:protein of unknown function [Candidatus Promineifilum breve]|uniref:Uncharacterized protein n=1 Tax=Candidatus Promineifilum breve TaxID=1806508 RepID=A0A160T581_9CHLR|nr:protein of unknown function [Candidatus Promineifilum breve]